MLKPLYRNILLFIFLRYFLFYIFLMFRHNDYTLTEIDSLRNAEDTFYYLWTFLFLPILSAAIFSAPIFVAFKLNNGIVFILLMTVVFVAEYFFYTYLASQADVTNGFYSAAIGLCLFVVLFLKSIIKLFKKQDNRELIDRLIDI